MQRHLLTWIFVVILGLLGCSTPDRELDKEGIKPKPQSMETVARRTYWDSYNEKLKESYTVLKDSQFVKHGLYKMYSEEGNIYMEYQYKIGLPDGVVKDYYTDGVIQSEYSYLNGKPNGPFKWYYPNGNIKFEGTYLNGHYSGPVKIFDENGILQEETTEYERLKSPI